ncbi:MAG: HAMP domain-containing histidine kinase [Gemmatimonadaceae bacterium]|nr:HAMP domain-containing histidine kinase [Gemmatimonadaceae bacterium]
MLGLTLRARLAVWSILIVAVGCTLLGVVADRALHRLALADTDALLLDAATAVRASWTLAATDSSPPDAASAPPSSPWERATASALANHRYRDITVLIARGYSGGADTTVPAVLGMTEARDSIARTSAAEQWWPPLWDAARETIGDAAGDTVSVSQDHAYRAVVLQDSRDDGVLITVAVQSTARQQIVLGRMRLVLIVGSVLATLAAALGAWALAGASLRPVETMRQAAQDISSRTLHARLPVPAQRDELARLAETFNALLTRIESAFALHQQFTADASHELRTPVAVITGESALALAEPRDADAYQRALRIIDSEGQRLRGIVDDLFLLARGDAGQRMVQPGALYLEELVSDCTAAMMSRARAHELVLEYSPTSEVPLRGDGVLLARAIMNLLDNAIKYTPSGGRIQVLCEATSSGGALVDVIDDGPGIPVADREHIFDRFYRVNANAVNANAPTGPAPSGAGLGLPIARRIVEAHGGTLELVTTSDTGSHFVIRLPATPLPLVGETLRDVAH